MRRLHRISRSVVPVTSLRRDPIDLAMPVVPPPAGRCWGKASQFDCADAEREAARKPPGVSVDRPDQKPVEYMRITPATLKVKERVVTIESTERPGWTVDVSRIESMSFSFIELLPRPTPSHMMQSRQTCVMLTFRLHPEREP